MDAQPSTLDHAGRFLRAHHLDLRFVDSFETALEEMDTWFPHLLLLDYNLRGHGLCNFRPHPAAPGEPLSGNWFPGEQSLAAHSLSHSADARRTDDFHTRSHSTPSGQGGALHAQAR